MEEVRLDGFCMNGKRVSLEAALKIAGEPALAQIASRIVPWPIVGPEAREAARRPGGNEPEWLNLNR